MSSRFDAMLQLKRKQFGEEFDPVDILGVSEEVREHYHGNRIIIESDGGFRRAGTVSMTTGQRPALLLMHRVDNAGSWDVIGPGDRLIAVQVGQRYYNVNTGKQEKVGKK